MKAFLVLLILATFIQTSFLPVNLVLLFLICRALIVEDYSNFWMAFFIGVFLGVLNAQNIGFWPLVLILVVKISNVLSKLPLSSNLLTVPIYTAVLSLLTQILKMIFFSQSLDFREIVLEAMIALPIYLLIKFWEGRTMVTRDIKLKIK